MAWEVRRRKSIFDLFNDIFDSVMPDFNEEFRFSDELVSKPRRNVSGFSVSITQRSGMEPKIEVQKFGPEGLAKAKPQKIQVLEGPKVVLDEKPAEGKSAKAEPKIKIVPEPGEPCKPVTFEQPQVAEGKDEKGAFVEILMPGIQDVSQVDLTILEQSIEVKAINQKEGKGYFWIVKIPSGAKKVTKVWATDRLRLYFL